MTQLLHYRGMVRVNKPYIFLLDSSGRPSVRTVLSRHNGIDPQLAKRCEKLLLLMLGGDRE